jgi:hypothetical protein
MYYNQNDRSIKTHNTFNNVKFGVGILFHLSVELSVFRLPITANKMQRFLNSFIFKDALYVSGGSSAHHQEHITVHTV